jgi:hypothetical protein
MKTCPVCQKANPPDPMLPAPARPPGVPGPPKGRADAFCRQCGRPLDLASPPPTEATVRLTGDQPVAGAPRQAFEVSGL